MFATVIGWVAFVLLLEFHSQIHWNTDHDFDDVPAARNASELELSQFVIVDPGAGSRVPLDELHGLLDRFDERHVSILSYAPARFGDVWPLMEAAFEAGAEVSLVVTTAPSERVTP